ncbi:hypothetical protein [Aquibacillus albus]|uniref:Uncharacterized protein n=1 Tax=Aquibacillus albus TaxID=1168171 RepID=A0ABS2N6C6_9BACI|nr:hypothetical protein [Aquibacillus albus]MBM7573663.1 hypothetical protein [Aquibacillus albus]
MKFYEELPIDVLIAFYNEINKNIEKGIITKSTYYELGLIISVMNRKGIPLNDPVYSETDSQETISA